jgi:peptidoglycan/LPS O-acetylase OafA/YrhL
MQHRPEIDGLRAVAVVPVVLFHAGVALFSGGYVGVDVFFVISGYLITTIIASAQDKGSFTILGFYERRARRIMPVLFTVILCCLPFAWAWMLPAQMESFGNSIIAVCLFVSNVLFWQESGYFAAAAEKQPLLHTWSLAVEEQYYLVFPILLMALHRYGARIRFTAVALLALASFATAIYGAIAFPNAAFYLPHTRAWELLAGSLCALLLLGRDQPKSNVLSVIGLVAILAGMVLYDDGTPFPSVWTLAPVGGTALIILFAGHGTFVHRLLSLRLLTGIGLISYSLYLWHQPLFAFARLRSLTEPTPALMAALSVAAVGLAILSWRFVETPFRTRQVPRLDTAPRILGATAATAVVFMLAGGVARIDDGLSFRLPETALAALAVQAHPDPAMSTCLFDKGEANLHHPVKDCVTPGETTIDTMLIGDSHAGAITGEALRQFSQAGMDLYALSHSSCAGFSGLVVSSPKYHLRCNSFFTGVEDYIRANGIKTVVMISRWSLYVDGTAFDNGEGGVEALKPTYADLYDRRDAMGSEADPARKQRVLDAYIAGIKAYLDRGVNVVLVYPIPEAGWNVPDLLARAAMTSTDVEPLSTSYDRYRARNAAVIAAFDAIDAPGLIKIKPTAFFCDGFVTGRCANSLSTDRIFYFDDDHLSSTGAALILPAIIDAVRGLNHPRTPG